MAEDREQGDVVDRVRHVAGSAVEQHAPETFERDCRGQHQCRQRESATGHRSQKRPTLASQSPTKTAVAIRVSIGAHSLAVSATRA
jgi:hypothetical protein